MQESRAVRASFDVRRLAREKQQAAIHSMFDGLPPGQSMLVSLDSDPAGLKRQFEAFFGDEHSWDCIQLGPPVWQILIRRNPAGLEC
ncbi:MAG: DUF2249 domain-containing protein [Caldilineaceae bacterium]|nr:DUF2249 domain-containing protein [Caldilineaceae bacterium]